MDNFDDFDTQIQCDESIPWGYEDEDSRGLTADERDERGLHSVWRDQCADDLDSEEDEDEFCAVFGADDPDNYLGCDYQEGEADDDTDW